MKHHYVPISYQQRFTDAEGLLWVYDSKLNTYKRLHPRSVCFQHDLYAYETKDGAINQVVETEVLSRIDGISSAALRGLPAAIYEPTAAWFHEIKTMTAVQDLRVPAFRDFINTGVEGYIGDAAEIIFGDPEKARASVAQYEAETGERLDVTVEQMIETYQSNLVKFRVTKIPFLSNLLGLMDDIISTLGSLDLEVLIAPQRYGFVLCDNPVSVIPPKPVPAGFLTPGTFTFMPLTRHFCLRYGPRDSGIGPLNIDRDTVALINENTAMNSSRFIMGPSLAQLARTVNRSGCAGTLGTARGRTAKRYDSDGGILRALIVEPRRFRYLTT